MKFAFLVMYELRALDKTIESLYKNIIDYYNADIFILAQYKDPIDIEKINLFNKNVVHKELYEKINPHDHFNTAHISYDKNETVDISAQNWNKYNSIQIYLNLHKMAKVIESCVDNYDYFIILRTDIEILFPFPNKELFENIPAAIYTFDPDYCRYWGGWAAGVFIHKNFILNYLNSFYKMINDQSIQEFYNFGYDHINQENFMNFALLKSNLKFNYIKNLNMFFTAESLNDRSTWGNINIHPIYNVIYKYLDQCDEAYNNLRLWENNGRWVYENDTLLLK